MPQKYWREESKSNWYTDTNGNVSHEALNTGCLMRIADAVELMAISYSKIINDRDYYQRRLKEEEASGQRMAHRIRGLQSAITRMKKKA